MKVFALILAILALACSGPPTGARPPSAPAGSGSQPAAQPSGPPAKVNLGELGSASDAGIYIALEKGYFAEQGIELERTRFQTAADMVAPLGLGQLDVGGGAPSAGLMNAIVSRDIPLRIVADKGNLNPGFGFQGIVVRKDLWDSGAIRGPADMRGRKIALNARDITPEVVIDRYLRTGGLTVADVDIVTMSVADTVSAIANGSVDVAFSIEPFVTQIAEMGTGVVATRADQVIEGQQVAVILYSPKFIEDRPDIARKFMLAYVKGLRDYNDAFGKKVPEKKAEVVKILTEYTPVKDAALYDKMIMPGLNPNGRVSQESLDNSQGWWLEKGTQQARADLSKVVDNQFVDWAVQQLGPYQ
jgi:NitT/TauT family transport system substrate-binding protein